MYKNLWIKTHQSLCSIQHWKGNEKIASGSGFIIDGYLVTNNHVFSCPPSEKIVLEFVEQDGSTIKFHKELNKDNFMAALKEGSTEENWDFAILEINELKKMPSLKFCQPEKELPIGMPIGLLGYAFGDNNLSIHAGMISSQFSKNDVKYIQVDASVNTGNSGGPLIDLETSEVIGIVTRAATGLTKMFDELIESFDKNIETMQTVKGMIELGSVDPMEALIISQSQMARISKEIKRSANVGIGYAFALDQIRDFFQRLVPTSTNTG